MYSSLLEYDMFYEKKLIEHYSTTTEDAPLYSYSCPYYSIREEETLHDEPISSYHQTTKAKKYGKETLFISTFSHPSDGFQFTSDCCRIDMNDYINQEHIVEAVTINGVFFSLGRDYGAVGNYKQDDFETTRPLPKGPTSSSTPLYEPYYRAITIRDGNLSIDPRQVDEVWKDREQFSHIMMGGPLLIDNGVCVATEEMLLKLHEDVPIFQCDRPSKKEGKKGFIERNGKKTLSCDRTPGELFHAANTNPRSAIAISKTGVVSFICAAGRVPRRMGVDVKRLADLILIHLPDTHIAINIDGGGSSKMLHKQNGTIVSSPSPFSNRKYVIGNIISFQKVTPEFKHKKSNSV